MPLDVHPLMSPPLPPSTPPPSSPTSLPTAHLPSSTTSSLHSLRTALSEAASLSLSHSHRDSHSNSNALLFSPESRKSAATDGTGATGSTEQEGAATRSLVMSVEGKMHQPRERASDVSSASVLSAGSWDQAQSLLGSPRMGPPAVRMPSIMGGMLPTPEPEEEEEQVERGQQEEEEEDEVRIKQESDDGFDDKSGNPSPSAFLRTVKQEEDEDDHYQHDYNQPARPLTNSQEDALLSSSVTRSQSDFNAWLDNTLRHARGDGTGSVIESDDALSSILLLSSTRRSTGRQASFGAFSSISASGSLSFSGALRGGGEAPISPPESETASFLNGDGEDEEEREEEQEKEELSEVEMEDFVTPIEDEVEKEKVEEEGKVKQVEQLDTPTDAVSSTSSPLLRWKLLTLALSLALIYQTFFRPLPPPVTITEIEIVEVPTTPSRYIPINDSLISTSHFATPIPLGGEGVGLGGYALLFTLLAGAVASIPLIRNARRLKKEEDEQEGEAATSSRSRSRASSPLAELNAADFSLAQQLLRRGIDDYSSRRLALAREHFSAVLPLACGAPLKSHASEWLGRTLYRLARADVYSPSSEEQMRAAVKAFERAVRLDPSRATPRASWGRALFRLGAYERAVLVLRAAVKRDKQGEIAFAHEWLAKALLAAAKVKEGEKVTVQVAKEVEKHLLRAIDLASARIIAGQAASSHAFLAAHLLSTPSLRTPSFPSPQSRLAAALVHAIRAVSLRPLYPAAHALLARVYGCEALDAEKAAEHWRAVVETRFVAGAERDEAIEALGGEVGEWVMQATRGWAPWKGWVFAVEKEGRREVLRRAAKEARDGGVGEDELLSLLLLVEEVTVERDEIEGAKTRTPKRKTRSTTPAAVEPAGLSPALLALQARTSTFQARCARFPLLPSSSSEDILVHGLYAVALLALDQGESVEAEEVFGAFWSAVLAEGAQAEVRREAAWVARAFWELKRGAEEVKEEQKEEKEVLPAVKVVKKPASTPTSGVTAMATRRVTRASSGTPTPAPAAKGRGRGKRVEKVEEEEEDAVTVTGAADGEEREEVVEEVKPVLRRSPRKVVKKEVE